MARTAGQGRKSVNLGRSNRGRGPSAHLEIERDELEGLADALVALGVDGDGVLARQVVEAKVLGDERVQEEEAGLEVGNVGQASCPGSRGKGRTSSQGGRCRGA